jgi:hypothetical protein
VGYVVYFGRSGAQNIDALFFMLGSDWHGFDKRRVGTRYVELVFLHPAESVGYVVHSGGSGARDMITLFFILSGGTGMDLTKSTPGLVTSNLCLCIRWNLWVM